MNLEVTMFMCGMIAWVCGIIHIAWTLQDIQRTIAKLPLNFDQKREIVLPPKEAARQGDVVFHIPSSLYGDRS